VALAASVLTGLGSVLTGAGTPAATGGSSSIQVDDRPALAALSSAAYSVGQSVWVDDIGIGYGAQFLLVPTVGTADGYFLIAASGKPGYQWALQTQATQPTNERVTFWTDDFDWKTPGLQAPLHGVPDLPTKRFLLLSGRVICASGSGTYTTGPTFAPGLVIAGVLSYRLTSTSAIAAATLNVLVVNAPLPATNIGQTTSTPWPLLDLTGLSATPAVEVAVAAAGVGTGATTGSVVLDGVLV